MSPRLLPRPLRSFAKGGNLEPMRNGVVGNGQTLCQQHRYPTFRKTQGRGILSLVGAHRQHQNCGPLAEEDPLIAKSANGLTLRPEIPVPEIPPGYYS